MGVIERLDPRMVELVRNSAVATGVLLVAGLLALGLEWFAQAARGLGASASMVVLLHLAGLALLLIDLVAAICLAASHAIKLLGNKR